VRLFNVFLGAPEGLELERRAFHEAVGESNQAEGLPRGTLFVPLFTSRKIHEQEAIDSNIQTSTYYLLALDDNWGPPGRSFEHDLHFALACREDPTLPMREVVVLVKKQAGDRPLDPGLSAFRNRAPGPSDPRRIEFDSPQQFKTIVNELFRGWLRELAA